MKADINLPGIPPELKKLNQWILWRRTKAKSDGRFGKLPASAAGYAISSTDPKNWNPFDVVVNQLRGSKHAAGIGLCLSGEPVDSLSGKAYLVGLDIDNCVRMETPATELGISAPAQAVLDLAQTYWELSPSGKGIRAFFYANALPRGRNKGGFEIYGKGRFLTVTGNGKGTLRELTEREVQALIDLMFGAAQQKLESAATPAKLDSQEAVVKLQAALDSIPAGISREQWVRVVLSIKAHGFECGEQKARAWSQSAGPYDPDTNRNGYEEKAFDDVWKCMPRDITPATLYFTAGQYFSRGAPLTFGDTHNGSVFAQLYRGELCFVYEKGRWLRWDDRLWCWCDPHEALEAAKNTAREVLKRAAEDFQRDPSSAEAKRKLAHGQASFNLKRLEAMLICAAAEPGMHVASMAQLDADSMLLGCENGVLDLRKGVLIAPAREHLITKKVAAKYDADAPCPTWDRFMDQVMISDVETIDYVQRAIGYTLTGSASEEVLHFCHGTGCNGKSVFANILRRLLGDYAVVAPAEMLMMRDRGSGANNDVARLVGARLLLANETRNGQAMDDLALKTLVSTEAISARFLHREFFEFRPTHAIWMRGNHKPLIRDESEGAWRRVRLIPFKLNLSTDQVDPLLEEKLWAEREGVLAWAVRGCLLWQKTGLAPSPRVRVASASYRRDCDLLGDFLEEQCVLEKAARISQRELWNSWVFWCDESGVKSGSKKSFTRRLEERGVVAAGWQGKERMYSGIRKRSDRDVVEHHHVITGSGAETHILPSAKSLGEKTRNTPQSGEPVALVGGV